MYVPKEQQIEGLTAVAKRVTMREFSFSTAELVRAGFLSVSRRHELIKKVRRIKGLTYAEYKIHCEVKVGIPGYRGMWRY